jgi:protein CpxP
MISIKKSLPLAMLMLALLTLGGVVLAQDAPTKANPDKIEKKDRMERRGEGFRMQGRRGMRHMEGMRMLRGIHQLDLTDAQKDQIKTLMSTHRTTNQPLMEEMRTLMEKRRDGTFSDADKARIEEIHSSMKASGDQLRATVLGLLTPEQNQKLEQMKAEREQRMQERKQRFLERKERMKERMKGEEKPASPVVKQP